MQIVLPEYIKDGFKVNYVCDSCSNVVKQVFYWLSYSSIEKSFDMPLQLCPYCKVQVTFNLTSIERPFKSSAFAEDHSYF